MRLTPFWKLFPFLNGRLKLVKSVFAHLYSPRYYQLCLFMLSSNSRYFPGFLKGHAPYYIYPRGFFPSSQIELEHMLSLLCLDKQCCLTGSILGVFKVILQHTSRIRSFADQEFFLMIYSTLSGSISSITSEALMSRCDGTIWHTSQAFQGFVVWTGPFLFLHLDPCKKGI